MTLGPVIAAFIIAGEVSSVSHHDVNADAINSYEVDRQGLARAFFVDGLTFAVSFVTLLFVKVRPLEAAASSEDKGSLYEEIGEAVKWVASIPAVRFGFIGMAVIHFFFMPMVFVGIPVWAKERFVEGAYVYGLVTAAFGAGALIGAVASGYMKGPKDTNLIPMMFIAYVFSGSTLALIIFMTPTGGQCYCFCIWDF